MPVYNGEPYLRDALDALLAQDYPNFELIISDNASTDSTSQICKEYALRDGRIRYSRCNPATDSFTNFNRVLSLARGSYFMWAAHDDLREPTFIRSLLSALQANPKAVLASCRFDNIDATGRQVRTFKEDWSQIFTESKFRQFANMALRDEVATHKATLLYGLMRTQILRKCGGMTYSRPSFSGEDVLTLLRLLGQGEFVFVDQLLFRYRVRSRTIREKESLLAYLVRRIAGQAGGHQGNLVLFMARHHRLHTGIRAIIRQEPSLSAAERRVLTAATAVKEVWQLTRTIPSVALRELNILHAAA